MPRAIPFWQQVDKTETCWNWTGAKLRHGYGQTRKDGRKKKAHRVAWEFLVGPIPQGLCVLHKCDNPSCVRPDHLFLGTQADNNRDRAQKFRGVGEKSGRAKITAADVRRIRIRALCGEGYKSIANDFHLSQSHTSNIARGISWESIRDSGATKRPKGQRSAELERQLRERIEKQ